MDKESIPRKYEGVGLVADCIYKYIRITQSYGQNQKTKCTEEDLIDTEWVQRLKRIHQLQSSWWVFPSGEHSRFQHALGTMFLAGKFTRHLYPSLKKNHRKIPSLEHVVELARIAGLLHDVGHGPFGHFFDSNFLNEYGITHEDISREIIVKKLGKIVKKIRRSPAGSFRGEIHPEDVAFLIKKPSDSETHKFPQWLRDLRLLFCGIYSVDNMDYANRDAYMTGISQDLVDIDRLLHYSFFSDKGLTLHAAAKSALVRFLQERLYLYSNVYYHRTTRGIDLHLKEIFNETMKIILPFNPLEHLDKYLGITDWSLIEEVTSWIRERTAQKKRLAREWQKILQRDLKWKMTCEEVFELEKLQLGTKIWTTEELEKKVRHNLPPKLRRLHFKVDMASQDPRPINPIELGQQQLFIYEPDSKQASAQIISKIFKNIPFKVIQCRIYYRNHNYDYQFKKALGKALSSISNSLDTNV